VTNALPALKWGELTIPCKLKSAINPAQAILPNALPMGWGCRMATTPLVVIAAD
jgi:hypothetical protein